MRKPWVLNYHIFFSWLQIGFFSPSRNGTCHWGGDLKTKVKSREPTDPGCWKCHPRMSMNFVHLWCCQSAFWPLFWFPKWIWPTEWGLETLWLCSWLAVVQDLELYVFTIWYLVENQLLMNQVVMYQTWDSADL